MQQEINPHQLRSRRAKEKFWQAHLSAQQKSGLTQVEYCRRNSLSKSTFGWWKHQLNKRSSASCSLVPVAIIKDKPASVNTGQQTSAGLTLIARSGELIEIGVDFHPPTLARVLQTLERR
jgi:hypothetical protein